MNYRNWEINYDPPPIPIRSMDWHGTSPEYDVDCDSDGFFVCGGFQLHAESLESLKEAIDNHILELTDT